MAQIPLHIEPNAKRERQREREFYEYFDALETLSGLRPVYCDITNPSAVERHVPVSSPDSALSAFCQLVALQLRAKRALLFFFNQSHAFILAEATPTLSLQNSEDELWMGSEADALGPFRYSMLDRTQSVCQYTVEMAASDGGPIPINIIPDLSKAQQTCHLPYVRSGSNKFYAGVPITTSNGVNIGAFCVLDDAPRSGLTEQEKTFLRDMSVTVMGHMEGIRAKADRQRGSMMVEALDSLISGSSDSRTQRHKTNNLRLRGRPVRTIRSPLTNIVEHDQIDPIPDTSAITSIPTHSDGHPEDNIHKTKLAASPERSTLASTFQRASTLLQHAIDVDEVLFFDASSISSTGTISNALGSDYGIAESGTNSTDSEDQQDSKHQQDLCRVLGQSMVSAETTPSQTNSATKRVSERFMKALLRRYPNGNIYNFFNTDYSSDDSISRSNNIDIGSTTAAPPTGHRSSNRRDEAKELRSLFPHASSLAVYGLYSYTRKRWYAACLLWSSSPTRLFYESEMNFVAAFCDVITEEISRQDIERSDRAKADFISSISHELRSPLHGILGSAEVLQGQNLDDLSGSMVHQISVCGRTLAEIVENLLDFSEMSRSAKAIAEGQLKKAASKEFESKNSAPGFHGLDEVTEEVVVSSVTAYNYNMPERGRRITTILDVEQPGSDCWSCGIDAGGWKRIVMNLVTNALKCTNSGHIFIGLKAEKTGPSESLNAKLSVQDTGKGMSKEFVQSELFSAFTQEDSFLEGTGLGMSIVARITKSLHGTIDVQTDQLGGGTCITVTVPLDSTIAGTSPRMPKRSDGISVGIMCLDDSGVSTAETKAYELQHKTLVKSLSEMGIEIATIDAAVRTNSKPTTLNITTEEYFDAHGADAFVDSDAVTARPLLVLCHDVNSERRLRSQMGHDLKSQALGFIHQPCGPRRLHTVVTSVLERAKAMQKIDPFPVDTNVIPGATNVHSNGPQLPSRFRMTNSSGVESPPKALPLPAANPRNISPPANDPWVTLMVVEDNRINLQLLLTYARKQGYPCVPAENGKQAFEAYKLAHETQQQTDLRSIPNIIIMDINMPVLSGFEATQAIRSYERKHGLQPAKIIALTGLGSLEAQREAYISGCDMFLSKPVSLKELTGILQSFRPERD